MPLSRTARPHRAVDWAAATIRSHILAGRYPAGSWLPAERELARLFGISRLTLRAAIARLESEGLVRPVHGSGVRVLDYRASAGLEVLLHLVEHGGVDDEATELLASFLELRRVLAVEAVALACTRSSPEQRDDLSRLLHLQLVEPDCWEFVRRDVEFARAVVRAAGSPAMELLLNTVHKVYLTHPSLPPALHNRQQLACAGYQAVVELLEAGDADEARPVVREALEQLDGALLDWLCDDGLPPEEPPPPGAGAEGLEGEDASLPPSSGRRAEPPAGSALAVGRKPPGERPLGDRSPGHLRPRAGKRRASGANRAARRARKSGGKRSS